MEWIIAAPFIEQDHRHAIPWLDQGVPGDRHTFRYVPRHRPLPKWHERTSRFTPPHEWLAYWEQAQRAMQASTGGVITVFPQLASAAGLYQSLSLLKPKPIVAWLFNVGICSQGIRRFLAQMSLSHIDRFVVHTRRECQLYSDWLGIPLDRFEFVPYQSPALPMTYAEETETPFITALGSAHRDFPTLLSAVGALGIPTVVASGKKALAGLQVPPNVETPLGISRQDCFRLAQQGCINVVPLRPNPEITAAGQVTLVEAMFMGRPLIATRCNGVEDYVIHGETGWLVEPNSTESLQEAIDTLWHDPGLRQRLGQAAQHYAHEHFSEAAAGQHLTRILDAVAVEHGQ